MDQAVYSNDGWHAVSVYGLLPAASHDAAVYQAFGGSESQVGLAAGLFTLSAVVFRPFVGALVDRHGRRPFYVWGLLLFVISMVSYDWVGGILLLLALRMVHGVSWAFATTSVGTAITDLIPASRRGEGMGWYGMAMTVAMAIGPMLGTALASGDSFHTLFLVAAGLSLAAWVLAFMTKVPFQPKPSAGRIRLIEPSVLPVTAAIFFSPWLMEELRPSFHYSLHPSASIREPSFWFMPLR